MKRLLRNIETSGCVLFLLVLSFGCSYAHISGGDHLGAKGEPGADAREKREAGVCTQSSSPADEYAAKNPAKLLVAEIMRMIHSIRPWPSVEDSCGYTESDWDRLVATARILQNADPTRLEDALSSYVTHYYTSFEDDVDMVAEWSKPLLLLRVMFDLPESEDLTKYHPIGCMGFGGFGWKAVREEMEVPRTLATPVTFRNGRPELTAKRAGYSGPPYQVQDEYRFFFDNFEVRKLPAPVSK
jgi:hypothetical protein